MNTCPNPNHPQFKKMVEELGSNLAYYYYDKAGYMLADEEIKELKGKHSGLVDLENSNLNDEISVKPGVEELFNSNPELANRVYEALGFNKLKQIPTNIILEDVLKRPDFEELIPIAKVFKKRDIVNKTKIILGHLNNDGNAGWTSSFIEDGKIAANVLVFDKDYYENLEEGSIDKLIYSNDSFQETVLHEELHRYVSYLIQLYDYYNKENIDSYAKIDEVFETQNSKERLFLEEYNSLYEIYKKNNGKLSKQEFITFGLTSKQEIEKLKSIKFENGHNLLKRIIKALADLISTPNLYDALLNSFENYYTSFNEKNYKFYTDTLKLDVEKPKISLQQKQQALQLYSQYLNSIFPNSKIKDIVYHGTDNKDIKFYKNNTEGFFSKVKGGTPNAIFFSKDKAPKDSVYNRGFNLSVLLDLKNPFTRDDKGDRDSYPENYKTTINNAENNGFDGVEILNTHDNFDTDVFVVFDPEQIHILGSKQDVEGFKNFVNTQESTNKPQELGNNNFFQLSNTVQNLNFLKNILEKINNYDLYFTEDETFIDFMKNKMIQNNFTKEEIDYLYELHKTHPKFSSKNFSRLISEEYSKVLSQNLESNRLSQLLEQSYNQELDDKVLSFLKPYGIKFKELESLKEKFGVDANGVADIFNKIIYANKERKIDTIPEEVAHFYVELIGTKEGIGEDLMNSITSWKKYNSIYEEYRDTYTLSNGNPDIDKIKKEAIAKAIAEAIVKRYSAEKDSFWKKIIDFLEQVGNLFKKFKPIEIKVNDIAKKILESNREDIEKRILPKEELKTWDETLKPYPEVVEVLDKFSKFGALLTGSLAIRKQGTLYRSKKESIHDLDFNLPYSVHKGNVSDTIDKVAKIFNGKFYTKNEGFIGNIGEVVLNGIITDDKSLADRFFNLTGDYTSRLNTFTEKERKEILLIDLFFDSENSKSNEVLGVKSAEDIFAAKSFMGMRAKDMNDLLNYESYLPETEDLSTYSFYQSVKPQLDNLNITEEQYNSLSQQEKDKLKSCYL